MYSSPVKRLVARKRLVQHGLSWLLTLQDGKGGFEFVGNPFKITGAVGDVDDLKKVLTSNIIFLFILLWNILKRDVTKIERPCLQHML